LLRSEEQAAISRQLSVALGTGGSRSATHERGLG
jgi:hypothetical protein